MKLIACIVGALVTAVALSATSLASESGEGRGGADRLFGGGLFHYDFDLGPGQLVLPRELSIYATGHKRNASGTRYYGAPDRPEPAPTHEITCLNVEGSLAVVGAIGPAGVTGVQYFDDNGPIGPDPADGITPLLNLTPEEIAQFVPRRFPHVCPSATPPAEFGDIWTTLDSGDIAVVEGSGGDDD